MAGEDELHDDNTPPPQPPVTPTQQAPHTLSTIKLPILKKGEYDIWAMKMEHYLEHTDYPIWEVLPPKTAEEILARERERKARTTLLMAIPEDHLAKFHKMTDAKEMWEAIKSRFVSNSEALHKGYDRFQSLLSQLKIHGAGVSTKDANQKFLRSLPASWSQVSLIMRTKPGVDTLSFDDLYNNLKVFESYIKGSTASSSSTQNVAFVSSESTNKGSSSFTDELKYSFFANQSSGPQLDHEDLEQVDEFDLEEMDLKWQVAMISMRLKKFYKKTERRLQFDTKEPVGFDKTKVECFNCHNTGHFARECRSKGNQESQRRDVGNTGYKAKDNERRPGKQKEPKALVTLDREGVDWTGHAEDEQENFALMAYSNSGSDTQVTSCSKECVESYAKLKKLYDTQREQLGDASIEIQAYTQALKKMSQIFTYGPKQSKTNKSDANTSDFDSCETNSSVETLESVPEPVVVEPKVVSQPKVWSDAPIIEEYELDNSPIRRPFNKSTTPKANFTNHKVNTVGGKTVSAVGAIGKLLLRPQQVGDEAIYKELGDKMERATTTASSLKAEQDNDAQTRFEAASKSPMIHLSQELTHLDVGRTL
ncbi:ribonuclease H-like domain-containing protein [Tanacetum coccineum]